MNVSLHQSLVQPQLIQIREIYVNSFPESERLHFSELVDSISESKRLLFAAHEDDKVFGFAILVPLSCKDTFLLEYLAVIEDKRSEGIGGRILASIIHKLFSDERYSGIIGEVEPIADAPIDGLGLKKRRIEFYQKNGAHILEEAASYKMPDLSEGGSLPMMLMWRPFDNSQSTIPIEMLKECIESIYMRSYGRAADDPLLQSILRDISDR